VTESLEHGERRFQTMAHHDAVQGDRWAVELAELVDHELGPALVTVLFPDDGSPVDAEALLDHGSLPLPVLVSFLARVAQEQRRLSEGR
jgi:hypothetical protein